MGVVFMAEQTHPVRRRVALKVIKAGMDTEQVIARFEAERQALALMDHPNIARVLDAGATASGRPFFVMELVNGVPITDYADEARLSTRDRLELLIPVCQAIQHAHQKGIIHRDVKPSNVLVTLVDGRPVPKVIDFGVAKATDQSLTERSLFTQFGAIVGTLEYMSPEQAALSGVDVDTRSDVYSLGVLLYELLTGSTPLERSSLREAANAEILRRIREEEPPPPSSRLSSSGDRIASLSASRQVEPRRLSGLVRGELDWIVLKALDKDRGCRYETANALARDLQRHLADEPVEAGPPSASYRLRKYARKHRAAFATAAGFAAVLLLAAAVSTALAIRASRAEARADLERAEALAQRDAAREARDAEAAERLRAEAAVVASRRAQQNEAAALEASRRELEKSRLVTDFLTQDLLTQAEPENNAVEDKVTLLEVLDRAAAKVGERYANQPELEEELRRVIAETYHGLASWEKAEAQWSAVLASAERRLGSESAEASFATAELGHILYHRGRLGEAIDLMEPALQRLSQTLSPEHPDTLTPRNNLANAYLDSGRAADALAMGEETLRRMTKTLGPEHPVTLTVRNNLIHTYRAAGRGAEAIAMGEGTLQRMTKTLGPEHHTTLKSRNNLAEAYRATGRAVTAAAMHEETLQLMIATLGPEHPHTLTVRNNLALAYQATARRAEALAMFEETLRLITATLGPEHPNTLSVMANLGVDYRDAGRVEEGLSLMEKAVEGRRLRYGDRPGLPDWVSTQLLETYQLVGRHAEAEPLLRDELDRFRSELGTDHPHTAGTMARLGLNLLNQRKWAEAEPILRECLALREQIEPGEWSTFNTRSRLGGALLGLGRLDEAEPLLVSGFEGMIAREASSPPSRKLLIPEAAERLARLYEATGRGDEAASLREKYGLEPAETLPELPEELFASDPAAAEGDDESADAP